MEPCEILYAADASPSGAGGCSASITREDWLALDDLAEEKGEHVRLDWEGEEPPSMLLDVRGAAAPLALKLKWTTLFSYLFLAGKHINLLKLESLISLHRRRTRAEIRAKRLLVLVDSSVVLGSRVKWPLELAKNYCLASETVVLVPRFRHRTGIGVEPYLGKSSRSPFAEQAEASFYAFRSADISSRSLGAESAQQENMGASLNPRVLSVVRSCNLPMLTMKCRRRPTVVKAIPRLQKCVNCLVSSSKNDWTNAKTNRSANHPRTSEPCDDPIFIAPSWFSAPPGLTLSTGAGPDFWRNELWNREGDIGRNPGPKRALLREEETSWCRTHYRPLPFQNLITK